MKYVLIALVLLSCGPDEKEIHDKLEKRKLQLNFQVKPYFDSLMLSKNPDTSANPLYRDKIDSFNQIYDSVNNALKKY